MAKMPTLNAPWLVAVWPGMGRVARTAGEYLAAKLHMEGVGDFPSDQFFEMAHVAVDHGLVRAGPRPRCPLFLWRDPHERHDIILLLGEAQPASGGFTLCQQIVEQARRWGVQRVVTFAAMATQMHPTDPARVFAAVTHPPMLEEIEALEVELLDGGQVGGLNGLMIAAAQEQGIEGACLLGELPYYATQVPNPKASRVVLATLAEVLDIEMDFAELDEQAEQIDAQLAELVEQLQRRAEQEAELAEQEESEFNIPEVTEQQPAPEPKLDPQAEQRLEQLFAQAKEDRSKAYQLKRELDRYGVFKDYEDRFLDLFKRGE